MGNKKSIDTSTILCMDEERVQQVKASMLDQHTFEDLSELFKIFSDPTRLGILFALSQSEMCVCDLSVVLEMHPSAVSHQLRVLKTARLVKYRRDGKNIYYSPDDDHILNLLKTGLDHVNHL